MATKENAQRDLGLWPKATFPVWYASGGGPARALESWGRDPVIGILDVGALKLAGGRWMIFMPQGWVLYDERQPSDVGHANRFSRYGAGHSFGEGLLNGHGIAVLRDEIVDAWRREFQTHPSERDITDVGFNRALASRLGVIAATPVPPLPPAPQPPPPTPPAPVQPGALSPLGVRVDELWSVARPYAVELLRTYRMLRKLAGDGRSLPPG